MLELNLEETEVRHSWNYDTFGNSNKFGCAEAKHAYDRVVEDEDGKIDKWLLPENLLC